MNGFEIFLKNQENCILNCHLNSKWQCAKEEETEMDVAKDENVDESGK